jgi:hypothetical protein
MGDLGKGQTIVRLFREARRRKVFRTAALYVLGAWLALQVADVLFPGFGVSNAAIQALVWAAVLGFPVALVFGWLFDIGPGGIRRTVHYLMRPHPATTRRQLLLAAWAGPCFIGQPRECVARPRTAGSRRPRRAGPARSRTDRGAAVRQHQQRPDNEYW